MEKVEILFRSCHLHAPQTYPFILANCFMLYLCQVSSNDVCGYAISSHPINFIYRIFTIGHSFTDDTPMRGCRQTLISFIYKLISKLLCFFGGMRTTRKQVDYDYTAFLGPNYQKTSIPPEYLSTYVSNHASWLDVPILISHFRPAFASKKSFKTVPIFGIIVQALGCLFISRGASPEKREQIVEQIGERQ